jgi:hypothetical protein
MCAETTNVDDRLSFADQGKTSVFRFCRRKQTEVDHFRLPFAAKKRKLSFSVNSVYVYIYTSTSINIYILPFQTENGKA